MPLMLLQVVRSTILAVLLTGLTPLALAEPPTLKLPTAVVPRNYHAELTVDPLQSGFSGDITIALEVREPVREIWLNARKITVTSAVLTHGGKRRSATASTSGEDYLSLAFAAPLPKGRATLRIRYTGSVQEGVSSGIFRSRDEGTDYLFTQFESTDARDAFPCFDEPGYKTPWQLTLRIPAGDAAVSNTPVRKERADGKQKVVVFDVTKPIPSYLVAFGVGPFDVVAAGKVGHSGALVRIITPHGKAGEARYAAEVTATILTQLEDYFGIPYPYPKADQLAIPATFGFGAMENPGLVTYAQTLILAKPSTDSIPRQRSYAEVAAHELSHQWFGDYVTTAWWDDIWLNEAFATWLQQAMTAAWKPDWNTRVDDVRGKLDVMDEDSLISARKIRQEILSRDDIANAFDGITYNKGAAVIGMFEHYRGAADFRRGVQDYMKAHAFGNATSGDFLAAQDAAGGKPIAGPFTTFLNQPGVPLLSVELQCGAETPQLKVQQQRLLPIGSTGSTGQTWQFPVCMRYPVADGTRTSCSLLTDASATLPLTDVGTSCPSWVEANEQGLGYYVVNYSGPLLAGLTAGAMGQRLSASERLDVLGGAKLAADAGKLPADGALHLVEALHDDADRHVVEAALDLALAYRAHLVPPALLPNYRRFLQKNFKDQAERLGWSAAAGESDDARLLRQAIVGPMATFGGDDTLAKSGRELAGQWLAGKADIAPEMLAAVLATGAFHGDEALSERYVAKLKDTQDRQLRTKIIRAIGSFRDPAAIQEAFRAVLAGDVPFIEGARLLFAGQDFEDTRSLAFQHLQAHYDEILAKRPRGGGFDLAARLPFVGRSFCDRASRQSLQTYFADRAPEFSGGPRLLAQVLEGIDLCIAKKEAQEPAIAAFLAAY
jgi:alanyl aminopeptidase